MLRKITYLVLFAHMLLLGALLFSPIKKMPSASKHVVVRTSTYRQPVAVAHSNSRPAPPAAAKPKKSAVNNSAKKKKAAAKPAVSRKILKEPEEITTKIDSKQERSYPSLKLDVPAPVGPSVGPFVGKSGINDYQDSLVSYLHQSLNLPDYGEVKIQLSLREDGTVAKMVVLKAESKKNKEYLEKNLPMLKFPRLNSTLKEETFVLTFCNEI